MRILTILLMLLPTTTFSDEAVIAVATNFNGVLKELVGQFELASGHQISIVSSSSGKLYAQVLNGGPFDVFLSADQDFAERIEQSEFGVSGSRFTYAIGRLALWSADESLLLENIESTLVQDRIRKIAIANPSLAPYGAASREVLQSLHIWDAIAEKIVMGENIGQTFALTGTGNADAGLIAFSLLQQQNGRQQNRQQFGNYIEVPAQLHTPIRQDAVLLAHGRENSAAVGFLTFLQDDRTREWIRSRGYSTN
jgi:molybdate transport system substrate-binding protein